MYSHENIISLANPSRLGPRSTFPATMERDDAMKRQWNPEELVDHFTLQANELELLANKADASKLGLALLLKSFQYAARFPAHRHEVPPSVVVYVAQQLELAPELWLQYAWSGRTFEY